MRPVRPTLVALAAASAAIAASASALPAHAATHPSAFGADWARSSYDARQSAVTSRVAPSATARRGATAHAVTPAAGAPVGPTAGDPYVAYGNSAGDGITWLDTKTRATGSYVDADVLGNVRDVQVSPDGTLIAAADHYTSTSSIEIVNAQTGDITSTDSLAESPGENVSPSITADDDTVVWVADSTAGTHPGTLYSAAPDGSGLLNQLASWDTGDGVAVTSTAGSSAAYYAYGDSDCAVFVIPFESGSTPTCTLSTSTLATATGLTSPVVEGLGDSTDGGIPFQVAGLSSDGTTLVEEIGMINFDEDAVAADMLPSTRTVSTATKTSSGTTYRFDQVFSPSADSTGTEVTYQRVQSTYTVSGGKAGPTTVTGDGAYTTDVATGTHRATLTGVPTTTGVGAYGDVPTAATFANEALYYPLSSQVRVLDTRNGKGLSGGKAARLQSASPIDVQVTGADVPAGATAVVLNVTAIDPSVAAYVQVYPTPASGSAVPTVSDIDLPAHAVLPNAVTVALPSSGKLRFRVGSSGSTDLAADVVGYYEPLSTDDSGSDFNAEPTPVRVFDTRSGKGGVVKSAIGPGKYIDVALQGTANVPASATAVVLAVGGVEHGSSSYVSVVPTPSGAFVKPTTSTLDLAGVGTTLENLATVGLGAGGQIRIYNSANTVDVFADVVGYYSDSGNAFVPVDPTRIFDTRSGTNTVNGAVGAIGQGGIADARAQGVLIDAYGATEVPRYATSIQVNLTAVAATAPTYLTLYATPEDSSRPNASAIDVPRGATIANGAIVAIGHGSQSRLYNYAGSTGAILDLAGYFVDD